MSDFNNNSLSAGRGKALINAITFIKTIERSSPAKETAPLTCICDRKVMTVLCRSCGMTFQGRVRQRCLFHPNSIHLMDLECCPNCRATQIKEFTETEEKRNI
uniref:Uncharacterized protein n=1 Tax=Magallana gigas TaxID=29159 RepID=A0A8W8KPX4_MAGGI